MTKHQAKKFAEAILENKADALRLLSELLEFAEQENALEDMLSDDQTVTLADISQW